MEGGGNAIVGLLESDDLESTDVIYAMKFARGTSSEGSTPNPDLAHFLDDMSENVLDVREDPVSQPAYASQLLNFAYLDGTKRGAREFQCPLDLEPV